MNQTQQRNSSIELLRIFAAMAVVVLHYNNNSIGGGFSLVPPGSINEKCMFLIENFFIGAVDLFVLISAYFLYVSRKRKLIKVIDMLIQVIIFRCAFYFVEVLLGTPFSYRVFITKVLPSNYYVILYLVLYVISPYINIVFECLEKQQRKSLVLTVFCVFSVGTYAVDIIDTVTRTQTGGLSPVGMLGSQYGYTIVTFVLMYIIGAYIRYEDVSLSLKKTIPGIMLCVAVMYFTTSLETTYVLNRITWNYHNPIVIILAVLVFLSFKDLRINSRVVNELAKGAFTCYIFHGDFMLLFGIPGIVTATASPVWTMLGHQAVVAVSFYLMSYVVYKIYSLFSAPVIRLITPLCDKVNLSAQQPY